jgi:hypothetical protein
LTRRRLERKTRKASPPSSVSRGCITESADDDANCGLNAAGWSSP